MEKILVTTDRFANSKAGMRSDKVYDIHVQQSKAAMMREFPLLNFNKISAN